MPKARLKLGGAWARRGRPVAYRFGCVSAAARGVESPRRMSTPAEIAAWLGGRPHEGAPGVYRVELLALWNRSARRSILRVTPGMGRGRG